MNNPSALRSFPKILKFSKKNENVFFLDFIMKSYIQRFIITKKIHGVQSKVRQQLLYIRQQLEKYIYIFNCHSSKT